MDETLRDKILNGIGIGLLAVCFLIALGRIAISSLDRAEDGGKIRTIRFAHWQLESGVREALDAIAAAYMKERPDVKVVQIPVPERIYPNWLITQLVGGTAPDLMAMGLVMTDERYARFFKPMSDVVDRPNPWNVGTPLEGVPFRETFIDGMGSCFNSTLLEYYGAPLSAFTVRMYYNLDLLREITGSDKLPANYEELVALCKQTLEFSRRTGRELFPIAGSKYNAPVVMQQLFASQTEGLGSRLIYDFLANRPSPALLAEAAARGDWNLDAPEIRAGLALMRDLGQYVQPGFLQLGRDDALFSFVQRRAVMISTGSWDATSIISQARFPVGVGYIPVPAPGGELGPFSRGPASDPGAGVGVIMGITRASPNQSLALDFLHFMTSQRMSQLFTNVSKWPPSVVGAKPHEQARIFQPFFDGFLGGFVLDFAGADTKRLANTEINKLLGPLGSVDAYIDAIRPGYLGALLSDIRRQALAARANSQRSDTTLGALAWMTLADPADAKSAERLDLLIQSMAAGDFNVRRLERAAYLLAKQVASPN